MSIRSNVQNAVGEWVQFRTPWGYHRGIVEQVNNRAVLVKVPKEYAPVSLASGSTRGDIDDKERLNTALAKHSHTVHLDVTPAFGGYGPGYGAGAGAGAGAAPGARWGYPGYGAWGGGWWWWWLAFAWIFFFAFWFW